MTTSTRRYGEPRNPTNPFTTAPAAVARYPAARAEGRRTAVALACAVAAVSLPTALRSEAGPDLWWHLHTGNRILDTGAIPTVDDLSFTAAGEPWANHEWLTQVVFALVHGWGGGVGLMVLRAVLFIGIIAGVASVVQRRVKSPGWTFAVLAPTVLFAEPYLNIRAHTFTYLFFVWTIDALDRMDEGRRRAMLALPVMMFLWVNLHGGFVLGLGLVGLTLARMMLYERTDRSRRWTLVAVGMVCVAATLLNPSGPGIYSYLVSELGANHSLITEWQPASGATLVGLFTVVMAVAVLSLLARRLPSLPLVIMTLGAAVATARHARFFVVLAVVGAVAAADVLPAAKARFSSPRRSVSVRPSRTGAVLALLAGVSGLLFVVQTPSFLRGLPVLEDGAPFGAAAFLEDHDLGGPNLVSHLDWGGFFIWTLDDDYNVAIDGRNLTVYDDQWVDDYLRAMQSGDLLAVAPIGEVDVWVLRPGSAQVQTLDEAAGWVRAYVDGEAVVFVDAEAWDGRPVRGPSDPAQPVFFPDA